jgi:hypothetical protein
MHASVKGRVVKKKLIVVLLDNASLLHLSINHHYIQLGKFEKAQKRCILIG